MFSYFFMYLARKKSGWVGLDREIGQFASDQWIPERSASWGRNMASERFLKAYSDCHLKIKGILRSKPNDNRNIQEEHTHLALCWKGLFKRRQRLCRVPCFRAVSNMADLPRRGTSVRSESDLKISPCPSAFGRSQPSTSCRTKSMQKQSVAPGNL